MKPFHVLFTRKVKAAEVLSQLNLAFTEMEMIQVHQISDEQIEAQAAAIPSDAALVFTSANAVRWFRPLVKRISGDWTICCLEGATRDAVSEFLHVDQPYLAAANAASLADQIIRAGGINKVFFICGDKRRDDLPDKLERAGINVEEIIVYKTVLTPVKVETTFDGIAFFSPSGVESFFMMNNIDPDTVFFSIGATTSEAIRKQGGRKIITSTASNEESMIASIEKYMIENIGKI